MPVGHYNFFVFSALEMALYKGIHEHSDILNKSNTCIKYKVCEWNEYESMLEKGKEKNSNWER